jgi:hypothetical protein
MSIDQRKRQKKLAKKKVKRKAVLSSKNKKVSFSDIISHSKAIIIARNSPVKRCFVRKNIFSEGIGTAIVSRQMPNGHLGVGVYLLDVWCLGVKNTYFSILSENEFLDRIKHIEVNEPLGTLHPSCARKIIEQCVEYSDKLGFKPHNDYKISRQLLMDLDPNVCPNQYSFGKDEKPFFISGPNENQNQSKKIVEKLIRNCGKGNFGYIVSSSDESKFL